MKVTVILIISSVLLLGQTLVAGLAVMSVDLGTEWMKVGIVSPGVPMEITLNKESKRKTPAVISFRDNVRLIGEDAQTLGVRFPKNAYSYVLDLLGKNLSHPLVKLYQERFPYYEIVEDPRGTISFKHDDDTFYSPEELVAQFLRKAKEFAENGAGQPIKECVITVPGYFNQVERKSLLQAADLAGLKVLQLINDYTAVALNYGIFNSKTFNESAHYVMFYDMGASSTTATLVSYQNVKTKERGFVETHPQMSVLGVGFDRTLGGLEVQIRLRNYLAQKFNEMKKTSNDVFKNPRAMAKLFKEAGRVKNVLSANAEHYAQIEGLLDEQDFKLSVSREELEGLCSDLFERVGKPVQQALKTAHLSSDIVNQVVLVGAGTRMPKIQEVLQEVVKQELAKNLNTDEAAAMGAVYKAADLSTGFKVKKFLTRDAVLYPIEVVFERDINGTSKLVKRTLFGLMNPYPQKKIITFNKHTTDFSFKVNYAELDHLSKKDVLNVGAMNLSEIALTGIESAIQKNSGNVESKGIKAHFNLDESGILNLLNVEYVVEKVNEPEEEGTFSKLGSTFSNFFSGKEEKPSEEKEKTEEPADKKEEQQPETEAKKNETEGKNATQEAKEVKPKIITVKEPIEAKENLLTIQGLTKDEYAKSYEKLRKLDKIENDINRRASAINNLESFVIEVQNKLYEDAYTVASTEEEIEKIRKVCSEVSDWLYEDGADAETETYEKKLEEVQALTRSLFARVWEHKERPEAFNALNSMLNHSTHFLKSAKNLTTSTNPEKDVFTDSEIEALEKLINEITDWKDKAKAEQDKLKKNEPVKLTVKQLSDKMAVLDREVKYLVNKIKMWRPKKPEKPVKEEKVVEKEEEGKTTTDEEMNTQEEAPEAEVEADEEQEAESIEPSKTEESDNHTEL